MIWDKRGKQTEKSFEAYLIYRNMYLQRSLAKVAKQLGKSVKLIERWNQKYNWHEKVKGYDEYVAEKERKELEKTRFKRKAEIINETKFMQKRGLERLKEIKLNDLKPADAIRLVDRGISLEADLEGFTEKNIKLTTTTEMEIKSLTDLQTAYVEFMKKKKVIE